MRKRLHIGWFLAAAFVYLLAGMAQQVPAQTITLPQSCPSSTFPSGFDASGNIQCRSVQWPADVTFPAIFGSGVLAETCVDLTSATEIQLVLDQPGQLVVGSHIEVRSVDDPLTFAYGTVSQYDNSTGTPVMSFVISQLQGGGIYCAYNVQIITKPQTAAKTGTRISLYQMNGCQLSQNGSTATVKIAACSIRDSTDTVDLVFAGGSLDLSNAANTPAVAGVGTISSSGATVTGSGTAFTTFFSSNGAGNNTDFNSQRNAVGFGATVLLEEIISTSTTSSSLSTVSSSTSLTTTTNLSAGVGTSYSRGGPLFPVSGTLSYYAIVISYNPTTGTVSASASSFTSSGVPDLPSGNTYYRTLGIDQVSYSSSYTMNFEQPLLGLPNGNNYNQYNVMQLTVSAGGDNIPFWGQLPLNQSNAVTGALGISNGGTGQTGASAAFNALSPLSTEGDILYYHSSSNARLGVGSNGQVLGSNGTDPAWEAFSSACTAATSSTFGCVKVDNSTITASSGVITTANTTVAGATCTPGSTCGLSKAQNTLSGDVTLNASTYTDGPSMAQGTSGTWFASGTVTINDTGTDLVSCKLWDGTTVISSGSTGIGTVSKPISLSLSGYLVTPGGNIRISCISNNATTTKLKANQSGASADSSIWGIRINFLEHPIPANDNDLIEKLAA